jgi:sporulation protein YlmC with PRC-barrel domain
MNPKIIASTFAVAAMTLYGGAYAQSSTGAGGAAPAAGASQAADTGASTGGAAGSGATVDTQQSSEMLASHIIGMSVKNGAGEKAEDIGKITDLVLDQNKQAVNVLIGVGGFLGIGSKDVGVPLKEVKFDLDAGTATVDMSRDQLEKAPAYETLQDKKDKQQQAAQQSQPAPAAPGGAPAAPTM